MQLILKRQLSFSELNWKILTLPIQMRNLFPPASSKVLFYDEDGSFGYGKMHSSGLTRIDGLSWWYKKHPNLTNGSYIGLYRDDERKLHLKVEELNQSNETNVIQAISIPDLPEEESVSSLSIEKDLERSIVNHINMIEEGLSLLQTQFSIQEENLKGILDILAKDKDGNYVIIELKAGRATEKDCGQVLKYVSLIKRNLTDVKNVRVYIIANDFDLGLKLAVQEVPSIKLKKYKVNFTFEDL